MEPDLIVTNVRDRASFDEDLAIRGLFNSVDVPYGGFIRENFSSNRLNVGEDFLLNLWVRVR